MEGQSNSGSPFSTSPKPHFLFPTMQNSSKLCIPHIYIGRWNLFWPFSTPPGARWTGASRRNWDYIVWKVSIGSWLWDWRISRKDSDWELLVLSVCTLHPPELWARSLCASFASAFVGLGRTCRSWSSGPKNRNLIISSQTKEKEVPSYFSTCPPGPGSSLYHFTEWSDPSL